MRKKQVVLRSKSIGTTPSSSSIVRRVRYRECQKNHAANIGGYAVDGCGEFMAGVEDGTTGPLLCAACGCHRNFHRKEVQIENLLEAVRDTISLTSLHHTIKYPLPKFFSPNLDFASCEYKLGTSAKIMGPALKGVSTEGHRTCEGHGTNEGGHMTSEGSHETSADHNE